MFDHNDVMELPQIIDDNDDTEILWLSDLQHVLQHVIELFLKKNRWTDEAQLARSGHFNTLPKRPNVDKFKHRTGPKAQKYR
jgi:hypothetical protein